MPALESNYSPKLERFRSARFPYIIEVIVGKPNVHSHMCARDIIINTRIFVIIAVHRAISPVCFVRISEHVVCISFPVLHFVSWVIEIKVCVGHTGLNCGWLNVYN